MRELDMLMRLLIEKGMTVNDIPERPHTEWMPTVKPTPIIGFAEGDRIDANEFEIRIWPSRYRDPMFGNAVFYVWEIHRNGLWVGNSESLKINGILSHGDFKSAQDAAQKYVDFIVEFGINLETP